MDNTSYDPTSIPPIPHRYRNLQTPEPHPRRRSLPPPPSRRSADTVPSSPEVISSLITSLSVISTPADNHFERSQPSLSLPVSPRQGSFGVDYGAFHQPSLENLRGDNNVPLDEVAAAAPVIRTAKPPSGLSPLTAPKSPARDASGGLKSLLRSSSRPSSKGSLGSRDDAQSIGNLSIERGSAPTPELRRQSSFDSWGKKQGRSHRGLMYMSSKERLREKEEKKRASIGDRSSSSFTGASLRPDPFLAETPISEEPAHSPESPTRESPRKLEMASPSLDPAASPRPIPARDSSLFKTGANAKRTSTRSSRSKRESGNGNNDIIFEGEEQTSLGEVPRRKHLSRHASENDLARVSADASVRSFSRPLFQSRHTEDFRTRGPLVEEDVEDSAPFPAVAQGRRREEQMADRNRRKPGRDTPEAGEAIKMKRSSSRLKRLSQPLSPKGEESASSRNSAASPDHRNSMPAGYERPRSADSIDDAVESYLCSPRLSQKIRHPQTGRVISFSEVGDADGSAVFCCVGMGLTRYITGFYDELALTLKLRLITPDRPGVGDSESYADGTATPLSWPDDVYAICQALKITKFSILAHSAGAIYALATALRMPQHIRGKIHLLAPWIPPSQMNVFGTSQALPPTNAIPTSQRILRALPATFLKAANSSFMSATSSSITSSLPKNPRRSKRKSTVTTGRDTPATHGSKRDTTPHLDKENLGLYDQTSTGDDLSGRPAQTAMENMDRIRPTGTASAQGHYDADAHVMAAASDALMDKERQTIYDTRLTHAIWELATTGANPAVDLLVCLERRHTIGFRYVDITRPVVIHHGSRDTRVPVDNVKWLGKTMKRCEVRVLEGEGHGLMASAGVMGAVLMEISKEWDDWLRATSKKDDRGRRTGTR
ncbi:Putative alpha/beta hydrolase-1 [Colletotrichum destructivum]|uniref:Alpha/beta hydrolase-1 n=1 Tax=Colletotrichum destructivum TaxID=34406 RepID=A0AAX4I2L7_9PEZI|nr:Putative alpha/beta hydrolase-1 [Colletotrichum destructivum]